MRDVNLRNRKGRIAKIVIVGSLAAFFIAAFVLPSAAQSLSKRLILKDGSYQLATKWEVHGDRVRYFSTEREDWEEVPDSLVDWDATNKYEKTREEGASSPAAIELQKQYEADRKAETASTPEVAPGLRLEDPHAAYLLETVDQHPDLLELQQNSGTLQRDGSKTMIQGVIVGANAEVVLTGAHAGVQADVPNISFYVNAQGGPDDHYSDTTQQSALPWDRFRIVSMELQAGKRVVGKVNVSVTGKKKEKKDVIDSTAEQITGGWVKITPAAPLAPGEYALVELLGDEGMNLYVWDFGVNAQTPASNAAQQPTSAAPTPNAPAPPTLQQR